MGGKSSKRGRKTRTPRAKAAKSSVKKVKVKGWGDLDKETEGE